jgi:hypothetical protein
MSATGDIVRLQLRQQIPAAIIVPSDGDVIDRRPRGALCSNPNTPAGAFPGLAGRFSALLFAVHETIPPPLLTPFF